MENYHHDDDQKHLAKAISELTHVLRDGLNYLKKHPGNSPPRVHFEWAIGLVHNKPAKEATKMDIKLTNEQQVKVTLNPKTDAGKSVKVDGKPTFEVISGNSTVVVAEDGLSAMLVSADDPGDTEILVKADADLGEGVEEISEVIRLQVAGATAKNLGLVAGTPETKPTA